MPMRKFASRAKRGLLVLSPMTLAVAMVATAAPATSAVSPTLRAVMQRDLGMSSTQLSQYLKIERLATQKQHALAKAQGRHFAGSWIEQAANGRYQLVVATTSIRPQKAPAGVVIRQVRHDVAQLNASKARLDAVLAQGGRAPKGVYSWYVDLPSNSVVVTVGQGHQRAGANFVAASGADARTVRLVTSDEQPSLRSTLKGGLGYLRDPGDGYLYACSIGFNVTKNGAPGYVSAGHCGDAGEPVYLEGSPQWTIGPQIGSFAASTFPKPGGTGPDYSWIQVSSGNTSLPTVYGWGKGDVTVTGHTEAAIGAAICRSGRTTGWHCGTIQAKGVTVNYSTGETVQNLTQTTACSEGGDSGGSYINGTGQAQGVLSGGSGSCKGDKNPIPFFGANSVSTRGKPGGGGGGGTKSRATTFFTPVNPILQAYGLTLLTGN
jgi:streptogrisin C